MKIKAPLQRRAKTNRRTAHALKGSSLTMAPVLSLNFAQNSNNEHPKFNEVAELVQQLEARLPIPQRFSKTNAEREYPVAA